MKNDAGDLLLEKRKVPCTLQENPMPNTFHVFGGKSFRGGSLREVPFSKGASLISFTV
jgi:hypothetical protein